MGGEMVAWCCCWWQHGGCEGGAAAAVTVDGGDGDDRDGVAVTCGGVKAAGDDGVEGVVVRVKMNMVTEVVASVDVMVGDGDGWQRVAVVASGGEWLWGSGRSGG
ncbi:hypothetical protein Tco_1006575 [Tanacetum coccineum]|uniref:Uncharacterized protein n=1 Tax=Tanacetum coccineum TaxID=301880 RepID=A0ABQ5FK13_9ASTR